MRLRNVQNERPEAKCLERETIEVYLPIVRTLLLLLACYYAVVSFQHIVSETGYQLVLLTSYSAVTSVICAALRWWTDQKPSMKRLEIAGFIANGLVLANVIVFYQTQFSSDRLVYFILMVIIFSLTSATRRLAILSSLAALASLYTVIAINDASLLEIYLYMGTATCFTALGGTLIFRRVITDALNAKVEAATHRSQAEAAAKHATQLSITDNLTNLPNRRDFFQKLVDMSSIKTGTDKAYALFVIDLDSFKPVNDGYGHAIGDSLLIAAGNRLRSEMPEGAYLARIGGDEFAMLAPARNADEARILGEQICTFMLRPFDLGLISIHIGATVGIAMQDDDALSPTKLLECADFALFNAKRLKRGTCGIFKDTDAKAMKELFIIEQAMRGCDLDDELTVVYQPQFDVSSNSISGFEALARWDSSKLGKVPPELFIGVAETSGLITDVTRILLRKALGTFCEWRSDTNLSFNLSVHDVLDLSAIKQILEITRNSGIAPSRICFEITETVMMSDIEKAGDALQMLVEAGHTIALDDFGTGYSNFSYLHKLPIDKIKIDKSLIRNMTENKQSVKLISTLLQLTRSLNKDCIVEGVETATEFAAMQGLGARTIQGYYFGKPMTAADAFAVISQSSAPPPQEQTQSINQKVA